MNFALSVAEILCELQLLQQKPFSLRNVKLISDIDFLHSIFPTLHGKRLQRSSIVYT